MCYYLMLDVGGTHIKAGVLTADGSLYNNVLLEYPACAKEDRKTILTNFAAILSDLANKVLQMQPEFLGIGMAFPGPFDFENGISLMQGLDKYESIYRVSLPDALKEFLPRELAQLPMLFLHDVEAFAMGVCKFDHPSEHDRLLHLCLGTGAGSAFTEGSRVLKRGEGVPENGWIYSYPYRDGIVDDYLSVRGLTGLSKRILGEPMNGLELYRMAKAGDTKALKVFQLFGEDVSAALLPFIDDFRPHGIVLGGQISGSFPYFGEQLDHLCQGRGVQIYLQQKPSEKILQGLYMAYTKK